MIKIVMDLKIKGCDTWPTKITWTGVRRNYALSVVGLMVQCTNVQSSN